MFTKVLQATKSNLFKWVLDLNWFPIHKTSLCLHKANCCDSLWYIDRLLINFFDSSSPWISCYEILVHMLHHAVPWGTALCGATLRLPEVKSYMIWCLVQREHILENCCDILGFKCFQRLLSTPFINSKSFWTFYHAFYKDILHFLNLDTVLKNKINIWTKWQIFTWYPRIWFMSSYIHS